MDGGINAKRTQRENDVSTTICVFSRTMWVNIHDLNEARDNEMTMALSGSYANHMHTFQIINTPAHHQSIL